MQIAIFDICGLGGGNINGGHLAAAGHWTLLLAQQRICFMDN